MIISGDRSDFIQGLDQLTRMATASKGESDRGHALIAAAVLDDMLKQYLESHLVKHKDVSKLLAGFNAPVGTFSSRILLSFAVGLISEAEYVMLGNIKKIRNEFAHSVQASFETPTISSHCRTLSEIPIVKSVMKSVKAGKELDPKFVFRITSALMILTVQDRLPEATDQRLSLTYAKSTPPI